jgi:hypothetical protein
MLLCNWLICLIAVCSLINYPNILSYPCFPISETEDQFKCKSAPFQNLKSSKPVSVWWWTFNQRWRSQIYAQLWLRELIAFSGEIERKWEGEMTVSYATVVSASSCHAAAHQRLPPMVATFLRGGTQLLACPSQAGAGSPQCFTVPSKTQRRRPSRCFPLLAPLPGRLAHLRNSSSSQPFCPIGRAHSNALPLRTTWAQSSHLYQPESPTRLFSAAGALSRHREHPRRGQLALEHLLSHPKFPIFGCAWKTLNKKMILIFE